MAKQQCPWGYRYNKSGTARSVNRAHRCNVSCHERWSLARCLQWAAETPILLPGGGRKLSVLRRPGFEAWKAATCGATTGAAVDGEPVPA